MSITVDAAPVGDVNPYTFDSGWEVPLSTWKVVSGVLRPTYSTGSVSMALATDSPGSGYLDVVFSVNHDQDMGSDSSGAAFCTALATGFVVEVIDSHIYVRAVTAGAISGSAIDFVSGRTYASGAQFRARYEIATGDLQIFQQAVSTTTPVLTVSGITYLSGMKGGIFAQWSDGGAAGIIASTIETGAVPGWVAKPLKVWTGSAWVTVPLKVWNGSAWVTKPLKVFT